MRTLPLPRRAAAAAVSLCLVLGGFGCGRTDVRCERVERRMPTSANHLASCTATGCGNGNPPTGGDHCGFVASCSVHSIAEERCRYIHNLEHGHVVFAYNCPAGCPEIQARLEELREQAKADAFGTRRALVTPDPQLPAQVAVMVWGSVYSGDEIDEDAVACILSRQDMDAPEPGLSCPH